MVVFAAIGMVFMAPLVQYFDVVPTTVTVAMCSFS
jgi:hypothetical protein